MSSFYSLFDKKPTNNTNSCNTCGSIIINGTIKNGLHYCDNIRCVPRPDDSDVSSKPMHPSSKPVLSSSPASSSSSSPCVSPTPRTGGKCADCNNTYGYCNDSIDDGKNWFCGKTCQRVFGSGRNHIHTQPDVFGMFASNMRTYYPLGTKLTSTSFSMVF